MKTTLNLFLVSAILILSGILSAQTSYDVYVSSRGTNAVKKYDMSGNYLGDFVSAGFGGLASTEDILFHPDGSVLVTGFGNTSIKRYDGISGNYLGDFSTGYTLAAPSKMSIGPDSLIYVTQWGTAQNKVVRFTLDGDFHDEFTSIGAPKGLGHVWDDQKNFYIALFGTGGDGTIHHFDSIGNDLGTFINTEIIQGPTSIWFDADGSMLVEDWTLGKVFRFDATGAYLEEFLSGMTSPEGIAFLPGGDLLIGDWGQDAVHLFSPEGENLGYFTSGNGLLDPNSVKVRATTVTSNGNNIAAGNTVTIFPTLSSGPFYIEFDIQRKEQIRIRVFDLQGRAVYSMAKTLSETGLHRVEWIPDTAVKEGYYLVYAEGSEFQVLEKIIIRR